MAALLNSGSDGGLLKKSDRDQRSEGDSVGLKHSIEADDQISQATIF